MNDIVESNLAAVYEEIIWLGKRPNTSPADARSWYTHVVSNKMKKTIRRFSGKVSKRAATDTDAVLRLEHYKRIQTTLTQLVDRHLRTNVYDPAEFVRVVLDCEQVNIVTFDENYDAMKAQGDYQIAGITLIEWSEIVPHRQHQLWKSMLRGKVSNANEYAPLA